MYSTEFQHKFKVKDVVYFRDIDDMQIYEGTIRNLFYTESSKKIEVSYTVDFVKYKKGKPITDWWNLREEKVWNTKEEVEINVKI